MSASNLAPVIGITVDHEEPGGYSSLPWYALRENYAGAVTRAGGLAVLLPHETGQVERYLSIIDGVIVTGGNFDIDPALFGAEARHQSVTVKPGRTEFEIALARAAIDRDMPVLGICGGQQLLNVVLGGTLIQHIPDEIAGALAHEQPNPRTDPGHAVAIAKDTLLGRITGVAEMQVNSAHHQAVGEVAGGTVVNATAPDGVIEGIELGAARFVLGVQWHPEFDIDPADRKIFSAFVDAARN